MKDTVHREQHPEKEDMVEDETPMWREHFLSMAQAGIQNQRNRIEEGRTVVADLAVDIVISGRRSPRTVLVVVCSLLVIAAMVMVMVRRRRRWMRWIACFHSRWRWITPVIGAWGVGPVSTMIFTASGRDLHR
jgi:hypothetical protein